MNQLNFFGLKEPVRDKTENYKKGHCWQYEIRLKNKDIDLFDAKFAGLTIKKNISCKDFKLSFEPKNKVYHEAKKFIERHEWLGKMSLYPTHIFTARYNGILAGVVVMDMPISFCKIIKNQKNDIERLISRGACISWSPKNLASKLVMFSIRYMAKNTKYKIFTAYSDPTAKEIGTIYQACNFLYLGQTFGAKHKYKLNNGKMVSSRHFRSRSVYVRLAKENNIKLKKNYIKNDSVLFENMPKETELKLRELSRNYQKKCEKEDVPQKHKYVFVLGKHKTETKKLRKLIDVKTFKYPKTR